MSFNFFNRLLTLPPAGMPRRSMYINMKAYFCACLLFFYVSLSFGQTLRLASWNIQNLGKSKSAATIDDIASYMKDFDLVAVQEVVAAPAGPQAVAKIADALNRKGAKWSYVISPVTSSYGTGGAERYAFLWKSSKLKVLKAAFLDSVYENRIEREPFMFAVEAGNKRFVLTTFHALPRAKHPETEIRYLKEFSARYPELPLIFCGDFNIPQSHSVFNPLKKDGYVAALQGQKTTLRQKCLIDGCLASEYDNFFLKSTQFNLLKSGVVPFYRDFPDVITARKVSDHLPVFIEIGL